MVSFWTKKLIHCHFCFRKYFCDDFWKVCGICIHSYIYEIFLQVDKINNIILARFMFLHTESRKSFTLDSDFLQAGRHKHIHQSWSWCWRILLQTVYVYRWYTQDWVVLNWCPIQTFKVTTVGRQFICGISFQMEAHNMQYYAILYCSRHNFQIHCSIYIWIYHTGSKKIPM